MKIPMASIKIGTTLKPRVVNGEMLTGFAIVIGIQPLPREMLLRKDMYNYDCLYTVLTDFGNTFSMSPNELLNHYELGDVEDVKERILKVIENHKRVLESLL